MRNKIIVLIFLNENLTDSTYLDFLQKLFNKILQLLIYTQQLMDATVTANFVMKNFKNKAIATSTHKREVWYQISTTTYRLPHNIFYGRTNYLPSINRSTEIESIHQERKHQEYSFRVLMGLLTRILINVYIH